MKVIVGGIIEKDGKYLLIQEAKKMCYGKWNFPAGHLDFNESLEQEPYEFARPKVKDMMLNLKQVEFMRKVKDDLYQQAVKKNEIKYN